MSLLTTRALNGTIPASPGISPATFVFTVNPNIHGARYQRTLKECTAIIGECNTLLIRLKAQRTFRYSATVWNILCNTKIRKVKTLLSGHQVFVYRDRSGRREYELIEVSGNEVSVIMRRGKLSSFPINLVRLFYQKSNWSESLNNDGSKAFRTERTTKAEKAKNYMNTQAQMSSENYGTESHLMNNKNDKTFHSQH